MYECVELKFWQVCSKMAANSAETQTSTSYKNVSSVITQHVWPHLLTMV